MPPEPLAQPARRAAPFALAFFLCALAALALALAFLPGPAVAARDAASARGALAATPTPGLTPAPRGAPADLWADLQVGKRDFAEITAREVVPYKLQQPGGVVVDRSVSPGRMYVWDAGNSRILGLDLAKCYATSGPCPADVVIGQPTGEDHGACNGDSSGQYYPRRGPASAGTLCGVSEFTQSTLEDKSWPSMYVDAAGNLYVPDIYNHRVLRYDNPFLHDNVADEVWGQPDFASNACNQRPRSDGAATDAGSLCFFDWFNGVGGGVTLDADGNMWVADGGNNRVLRFPAVAGKIARTANLALGQPDFGGGAGGAGLDQFYDPSAVRFDAAGRLYVADMLNSRVLRFAPPFTTGQAGEVFASFTNGVAGVGCPSRARTRRPRNSGVCVTGLRRKPSRSSRRSRWRRSGSSSGAPSRATSSRSAHSAYSPMALCPAA